MLDLLIRNGEVVTPQGVGRWTVGVKGDQIAYVGLDDPSLQAGRTIDAAGKIVVPGGIEPHAHLDIFDLTNPDSGKSTLGPEDDTAGWPLAELPRERVSLRLTRRREFDDLQRDGLASTSRLRPSTTNSVHITFTLLRRDSAGNGSVRPQCLTDPGRTL
jgi:imidazolonepropionase-like amidohydrolase